MVVVECDQRKPEVADPGISLSDGTSFDEFVARLGEPFSSYAVALLKADEAKKKLHAAQVAGNAAAVRCAELEWETAASEVQAIRHHEVQRFLFGLRVTLEDNPAAVLSLFDAALGQSERFAELKKNIVEIAEALVAHEVRLPGRGAA